MIIGKMSRKQIRLTVMTVLAAAVLLWSGLEVYRRLPGERQARRQVDRFVEALDYNHPDKIYPLLTPELRASIDKSEFVRNFVHERSYPYLTPLFIYVDSIEFDEKYTVGHVICTVASRLPGEFMDFYVRYTPGKGYFIDALHPIVDGSYIELFERL